MSFKHGPNLPKKTSWVVRVGNPTNYLLATNMSCILYYHHCFNQSFFLVSSYHYPLVGDWILSFYFLFCFVLLDSQESLAKQAKYVTIIACIVFIYNFRHYFIFDLKADSGRDFFANIVSILFLRIRNVEPSRLPRPKRHVQPASQVLIWKCKQSVTAS